LEAVELLKPLLESDRDPRSLLALQLVPGLKEAAALFAPLVQRFIGHSDAGYRLAAIHAGASGDWPRLIADDPAPEVRAAAVRRLSESDEPAIPTILCGLSDNDWRVRAAATEALRRLGDEGVRVAKGLMASEDRFAKLAATQVLLAAGEYEWLESHTVE
jgi:HEAT repeat protein